MGQKCTMHFCCLSLCCILPWMPNTIRRRPSLLHHRLWLRLPFATTWLSGRRSKSNYYHIPFIYPQKQHTNTSALVVDRFKRSKAFLLERKFEFKLQLADSRSAWQSISNGVRKGVIKYLFLYLMSKEQILFSHIYQDKTYIDSWSRTYRYQIPNIPSSIISNL